MLKDGERAVLQFSGGKDSTALLYLARPHLDRITVLFGDTGAIFPHVVKFVRDTCEKLGARLNIVHPMMGVEAYTAKYGLPSDIVPVETTLEMVPYLRDKPAQMIQSYLRCCSAMIWEPMQKAIRESGAKIVLRGSKREDLRVGVPSGYVEDGIEYRSPLWDWSDADVFAYLKQEGVTLPAHYESVNDSLDCWLCTAHLAHGGAGKMRFIRSHYPGLWPEVQRRMRAMKGAVNDAMAQAAPAVSEAMR